MILALLRVCVLFATRAWVLSPVPIGKHVFRLHLICSLLAVTASVAGVLMARNRRSGALMSVMYGPFIY